MGYIFVVINSFFWLMCSPRGGSGVNKTLKLPCVFRKIKTGASQPQNFAANMLQSPFMVCS